jgi:serine/threonine protein kinase
MLGAIDIFRGTKRFIVEGKLGEGGMGVVHRVRDVERQETLALKTMTRLDAAALLRFKREFRALADITHPNVVQLYELFSEGDQWFFTMELVDGSDLLAWVHSSLSMPPPARSGTTHADADAAIADSGEHATVLAPTEVYDQMVVGMARPPSNQSAPRLPQARARFAIRDVARLRAGFRQLAAGVSAIHAAGKLHRDIKPSNVMVTRGGRVVLLDFGVVGEFVPGKKTVRNDDPLVGTPAYMAPEQAAFQPATPASDWYAVGVILFEALTRRMPFEGSTSELLIAKQRPLDARPSALVEGIPEDLEQLCVDLLQLDPRARPTADEVLRRLEGDRPPAFSTSVEVPFVGRRAQLDELHAAYAAASDGSPVVVMLQGRSGMGKSALVSRFIGELSSHMGALVLSGRCYEREAVPFKAVDQIVDELSRWLARLPEDDAYALLPRGIHALARLFPVMRNPRVVAAAPDVDADVADPLQMRQRAFVALRELLTAIAASRTLVLHIDDLQWGDADSVQLLEALLSPPAPRPLLLVCGHRSELASSSEALAALRGAWGRLSEACDIRDLDVAELSNAEAHELARALVDSSDPVVAEAIALEAHGSPLFVAELARWANERREITRGDEPIALEQVILARVAELPADARALLETISIAGTPLEHAIAEKAAGIVGRRRGATMALRGARFVSTRGLRDVDMLETAHDRIRETVAASLDDAKRRACHLALANAIASFEHADPAAAFDHFRAAGDDASARDYALRAADAADRGLAFSRAAALYRAAIALGAASQDVLYAKLGDALANAGRGAEAADAYLEAASRAPERDAGDLRRIAAEHYLKSGQQERGLAVLRQVLAEVGLNYPESTEAAVASLVWHEARVRVASLVRAVRRPQSLSRRDLARR